jgi:hypothetical protein
MASSRPEKRGPAVASNTLVRRWHVLSLNRKGCAGQSTGPSPLSLSPSDGERDKDLFPADPGRRLADSPLPWAAMGNCQVSNLF